MLMAKRFGRIKDYNDWLEPKLVSNAIEILDQEIPKYRNQIDFVHLCFTTDPFMYCHPEVEDLTLRIIKKLNDNAIKTTVLTKGIYPKVLAETKEYGNQNTYGITLVSLSEDFKQRFECFSAPLKERIASLKYLHDAGLKTWASIEPYPPPNLVKQDVSEILDALSFVDRIIFGKMNYNFKVNSFAGIANFYEDCANTVIDFCRKKKIEPHIKKGTRIENKTTNNVSTPDSRFPLPSY
jgi:DNA repair photolyase